MKLKTPLIIVNYKTYDRGSGKRAVELTKIIEENGSKRGASVAVAVQPTDIYPISNSCRLPVLAQHIDPINYGSHTGHILPESVRDAGAVGTLINHSERRMKLADLSECVTRAKANGLVTVVCANDVATARACASLDPDFVAVEPPELIGGDISVSKAKPEVVSGTVDAVKRVNPDVQVLCGAGVKNGDDVAKALQLGAVGVLLASGVVNAKDPDKVMEDLIDGLHMVKDV